MGVGLYVDPRMESKSGETAFSHSALKMQSGVPDDLCPKSYLFKEQAQNIAPLPGFLLLFMCFIQSP